MKTAVLAIDQGTTNSKALLVDPQGNVLASGSQLVPMRTPSPGWFTQPANQLWQATMRAVDDALKAAPEVAVAGVAIANQRESVVAWQADSGLPASEVIGWQDTRAVAQCQNIAGQAGLVADVTGLRLSPLFSAPKMAWLINQLHPAGDIRVGTLDAYLVARLTGGDAAEAGNASRTMLMNLDTLDWDDRLLDLFGIPRHQLPPVVASNAGFGVVRPGSPIPTGTPVVAVMGDSHAALFAQGATSGTAKVTYGTGSSVMVGVNRHPRNSGKVATTLAWLTQAGPRYALEGNIIATGAALQALATLLNVSVDHLAQLAVASDGDVTLSYVPAFAGLGAPYWDEAAKGVLVGLNATTSPTDLALAGFDAIAQQVCDIIDAMDTPVSAIAADGNGSTNAHLMQWQSDLSGRPVTISRTAEASAAGVAAMAWRVLDPGLPPVVAQTGVTYKPRRDASWAADQRTRWADAVARSQGLAKPMGSVK